MNRNGWCRLVLLKTDLASITRNETSQAPPPKPTETESSFGESYAHWSREALHSLLRTNTVKSHYSQILYLKIHWLTNIYLYFQNQYLQPFMDMHGAVKN